MKAQYYAKCFARKNGAFMSASLLLPLMFALASIFIYATQMHFALKVRRWPSTQGKVLSSSVNAQWHDGRSDSFAAEWYRAHVVYEYYVDGARYQGDRVATQSENVWHGHRRSAERVVEKFTKGATVTVHYAPNEPRRSAIAIGIEWRVWVMFVAPLVVCIALILLQLR
jgi:hypothetical protein